MTVGVSLSVINCGKLSSARYYTINVKCHTSPKQDGVYWLSEAMLQQKETAAEFLSVMPPRFVSSSCNMLRVCWQGALLHTAAQGSRLTDGLSSCISRNTGHSQSLRLEERELKCGEPGRVIGVPFAHNPLARTNYMVLSNSTGTGRCGGTDEMSSGHQCPYHRGQRKPFSILGVGLIRESFRELCVWSPGGQAVSGGLDLNSTHLQSD